VVQPIGDAQPRARPRRRILVELDATSAGRVLAVALAAAALLAVVDAAPSIITKIGVGIVVALALDPVVVRVQRRFGWQRGSAVGLVGSVLGLAFLGVLGILGPAAIDQAGSLRQDLPDVIEEAYSWPVLGERLERNDAATRVDEAIDDLPANLDDATLTRYAEDLLGGLLTAVIVLVTAVGVMLDGARLVERFRHLFDDGALQRVDAVGRVIYRTFGNYFAGSLFVAILNGLVILTLALVLGVPLAPLAGLWSTLTNLIPQIGGFLGGGFFVLLALTQGPVTAAIAAVAFLVYQNLENNVIQPAVVGKAVDLSPPTTMLAALIGGAVAGVPGALIATPIVGAVKVLYLRDAADGDVDLQGIGDPLGDEADPAEG
jgi:predicted PurR-regulated permease PerM